MLGRGLEGETPDDAPRPRRRAELRRVENEHAAVGQRVRGARRHDAHAGGAACGR